MNTIHNSQSIRTGINSQSIRTGINSQSIRTGMDTSMEATAAPPTPNESAASTPPVAAAAAAPRATILSFFSGTSALTGTGTNVVTSPTSAASQPPTTGTGTGTGEASAALPTTPNALAKGPVRPRRQQPNRQSLRLRQAVRPCCPVRATSARPTTSKPSSWSPGRKRARGHVESFGVETARLPSSGVWWRPARQDVPYTVLKAIGYVQSVWKGARRHCWPDICHQGARNLG